MEELSSRLALEVSRKDIFERKNAELERINDGLRVENANLLNGVEELEKKICDLEEQADSSQSDDSSDEHESEPQVMDAVNISKIQEKNSLNAADIIKDNEKSDFILAANSNGNNAAVGQIEVKIRTLKRKQKALKAELHHKTMGFQEAFQNELDLRTRIEENYDTLRTRYDRLILENEHLRSVLSNHCIDVPPHQSIGGNRRPLRSTYHARSRPPSFAPPFSGHQGSHTPERTGRSPSPSQAVLSSPHGAVSKSPDPSPLGGNERENPQEGSADWNEISSPLTKVSAVAVTTNDHTIAANSNGSVRPHKLRDIPQLLISGQEVDVADIDRQEVGVAVPLLATGQSGLTGSSSSSMMSSSVVTSSDSESELAELEGDGDLEHIIIEEKITTPTSATTPTSFITQEMESIMMTTSDQLANAKAFYDLVRQRMKSESDSD